MRTTMLRVTVFVIFVLWMGPPPGARLIMRTPTATATPTRSKRLFSPCCGAAISLSNGLRCRPANTNLHAINARKATRETVTDTIYAAPSQQPYCHLRLQPQASDIVLCRPGFGRQRSAHD